MTWFLPLVKSKRLLRPSRISKLSRRLSEDPILPVELWDVVLNLLNNDGLLLAACVCRTWNEIAIGLYMQRHSVNGAPVVLQIPAFLLKPLHISCTVPQIHTLRCSFPVYAIVRHMQSLEGVVAKCPRLMNPSIEWGRHLFRIHSSDSPETVISILRDLLRTLASRTPGPVFVLENGVIQRFETDDVRRWPLIAGVQSLTRRESRDNIRAAMMAHDVDGEPFCLTNPSNRNSVDVRSIRVGSGPLGSFTQITFPTTILSLHPTDEVP